jgi:phosphoglycerate dehydrogenase-like enzyme
MTDQIHVLCTEDLPADVLDKLRAVSPRLVIECRPARSAEELSAALTPETEILYGYRGDFDLARAPRLRWVQLQSAGINHVLDTPLWRSDVQITSANGVHAVQIGEYALTMLLAHFHKLPQMFRHQTRREWARGEAREALTATELRDATLGVVGYGAIGREAARLARAFGMRILATKRAESSPRFDGWSPEGTGDPDGSLPERFYTAEELPAMLPECDAILLSLPLSDATRHLIGPRELAAMRPHALIINVGRGALVDQDALVEALRQNRIGGAALDVTDPEPLPADSPLWEMGNVIISPHVSGPSRHYEQRAGHLFAENLRRYLAGEPLLNLVSRERGY